MKAHVRKSTQADIDYLSTNLRPEDEAEVIASHGDTLTALQLGLDYSDECLTFIVSETNEIAGIFGVAQVDEDVASVWLLSTPAIKKIWIPFLRQSKKITEDLNKKYRILTNAVDEEYTVSIKWLKFLGFTFIKRHDQWGQSNKPFLEFVRIVND